MKPAIAALLLFIASSVDAGQGAEYVNAYFELWLKDHNFSKFEKKKEGIYFPGKAVLLDGEIHEATELKQGQIYSVESRISVTFKNGRRLDDFVAGVGTKADKAFYDSLQNFCLTTLHPIYAELFDHNDPHVRKQRWPVNGVERRIFLSEWGHRGTALGAYTQTDIEKLIAEELRAMNLTNEIHWIKLVVMLAGGQLKTLVVTIDGETHDRLAQRLARYAWPQPKDFTMAKLFFVIGEVEDHTQR